MYEGTGRMTGREWARRVLGRARAGYYRRSVARRILARPATWRLYVAYLAAYRELCRLCLEDEVCGPGEVCDGCARYRHRPWPWDEEDDEEPPFPPCWECGATSTVEGSEGAWCDEHIPDSMGDASPASTDAGGWPARSKGRIRDFLDGEIPF